jgi:hypothetical protein
MKVSALIVSAVLASASAFAPQAVPRPNNVVLEMAANEKGSKRKAALKVRRSCLLLCLYSCLRHGAHLFISL